jgi:flagellar basal body-associated protein FliL
MKTRDSYPSTKSIIKKFLILGTIIVLVALALVALCSCSSNSDSLSIDRKTTEKAVEKEIAENSSAATIEALAELTE